MSTVSAIAPSSSWSPVKRYFLLFAGILLASMALRIPIVYSFQQFGFYDQGTALHGLALLDKGYVPSVDFGYTHGLLSLDFSRVWMGLFGRTPVAFVAGVMALQLVIALGLARLAAAVNLGPRATLLLCCLLPWAVIPDYLTLTHPLEAAIIANALAFHALGKRQWALALLTLCLFVKPSMAYVYGLVLVLLMLRESLRRDDLTPGKKAWDFLRQLIPAGAVLAACLTLVLAQYGATPVKNTLFAVAGASAYKETNFGLLTGDGRNFWLPLPPKTLTGIKAVDFIGHYLFTPAGIWIVAVLTLFLAGGFALLGYVSRPFRKPQARPMHQEILATLLLIHSAFLFIFYGWEMSWTYYAYMPFFALCLTESTYNFHKKLRVALVTLACLAHVVAVLYALGGWTWTVRNHSSGGLFAWKDLDASYREALAFVDGHPTLLMTNGYPANLPPNVQIPDAWFPETGIALPVEIDRVHKQALEGRYVIINWRVGDVDLWNNPRFADVRAKFQRVEFPTREYKGSQDGKDDPCRNSHFEVWEKKPEQNQPK